MALAFLTRFSNLIRAGRVYLFAIVHSCLLVSLLGAQSFSAPHAASEPQAEYPELQLSNNSWRLISLPLDPGTDNTVAAVFGDDLSMVNYDVDWALFTLDDNNQYLNVGAGGTLAPGVGYWIIQQTGAAVALDLPATSTPVSMTVSEACSSANGCYEIPIKTANETKWNLIGATGISTIGFDVLRATTTSGLCITGCTLNEAEAAGYLHNQMWRYPGSGEYQVIESGGNVSPWEGIWFPALSGANNQQPKLFLPHGDGASSTQQSIYFVGNSVSNGVRYETLKSLAEGENKTHAWGRHMIPGAPLQWNWDHPELWPHSDGAVSNPPYGGYQQALNQYSWKSLSLQPYDRSIASDTDYAGRFMDLALAVNPDTQVYVFAFYPRLNFGDWETQWLADSSVNTSRAFFQQLTTELTTAHPQAKPVLQFPVGEVLYRLKQKIDDGEIDGLNSILDFYNDDVHLHPTGEYVVTMTVYSMLYEEDPDGLPFAGYAGVDQALATEIQQQVWEVVQEYLPQ